MAGPVYPWREDCRYALLIDGEQFYPCMLSAVQSARRSVELELYLVSSGAVAGDWLAALVDAARRGVRVRCLLDGFGSLQLQAGDRKRLVSAGVQLRFYNPLRWLAGHGNLHRDHRKLLLVDDEVAFVGGAGLTDDFYHPQQGSSWHELMLKVEGSVVVDWLDLFERQWLASAAPLRRCPPGRWRRLPLPAMPAGRDGLGRVSYTDAAEHQEVLRALLAQVAAARQRIWLATPYFIPGWRVRRALRRAARRGVDVRLLLCGQITDHPPVRYAGQRFFGRLLGAGVKIFEYQPRFLHLKMVLVDDWVSIGSCNFDHWALHWNLEANQQVLDRRLLAEVDDCFVRDFACSREWTQAQWRELPWHHKAKILVWGQVSRWLMLWTGIRG